MVGSYPSGQAPCPTLLEGSLACIRARLAVKQAVVAIYRSTCDAMLSSEKKVLCHSSPKLSRVSSNLPPMPRGSATAPGVAGARTWDRFGAQAAGCGRQTQSRVGG